MNEPGQQEATRDTWYLVAVGGLLVIIVASLAALWLLERNRRVEAERRLVEVRNEQSLGSALAQMGMRSAAGGAEMLPGAGISRSDIADVRVAELDGRPRNLWVISAGAGRRVGLEPGDLVEVAPAPRTQPAEGSP